MIAPVRSPVYYDHMGEKRYIVKPAYFTTAAGRVKLYLFYDTEQPRLTPKQAMEPNVVIRDAGLNALLRFCDKRGITDEDVRIVPARVLSAEEAARYQSEATDP